MSRYLHIVCLDTPWPADYGGAIDMFCKIEALQKAGIRIHLHYFSYNERGQPEELKPYCESIHVYARKKRNGISGKLPFIVASRINDELIANLNKDEYPVLLEGVHCTGIIAQLNSGKKIVVRLHNDESEYYHQLAATTNNFLKKIYFNRESRLLKKYQHSLPKKCTYLAISKKDAIVFQEEYKLPSVHFLAAFIPFNEVAGEEGIGNFCLYHGNLSVPENEKAALWLATKVFPRIKVPLVIAGKDPSRRLDKLGHLCQHTCMVSNPSEKEMNELVKKAHIHVLPSFGSAGIKIKLLHALFEGRHCVVNNTMIEGTGLEDTCHIATNADAFASVIMQLHHLPYGIEEISLRKRILEKMFDKENLATQLIQYLY